MQLHIAKIRLAKYTCSYQDQLTKMFVYMYVHMYMYVYMYVYMYRCIDK